MNSKRMKVNCKISGFADEIAPDLKTQIEVIRKLGMHYIEMRGVDGDNLIYHTDEKVRSIKQQLDENEIKLSALGSPLGKIGIEENFAPHFEQFKRAVEIAHKMETANIRMFSFYLPKDKDPSFYQEEVVERIGQFVTYAAANEVVLLHENEKGIYGERAGECKKLLDLFGGVHFQAIFDFANFVQCRQDTMQAYELLREHIAYIHVKDAIWESGAVVPAGRGDGHVKEILALLQKDGFAGFLSLEPHLFDFQGFDQLETRTKEEKKDQCPSRKLTGQEAFTLAHQCLMEVVSAT